MPKRRSDSEEEKLRRKIRRYERKLANLSNQEHETYNVENYSVTHYDAPDTIREDTLVDYDAPSYYEYGLQDLSPVEIELGEPAQSNDIQQATVQSPCDPVPAPPAPAPVPCLDTEPAPGPSTLPTVPLAPVVDPDLLSALGECHTDTPEWGEDILSDISQRWQPILKSGLTKEVREGLNKKYIFPKNMPMAKPPVLNPEISAVLTEASRNRDIRVCNKQGQLGNALTALGKVMTGLLTKNMETSEILRILNDTGKLIADSHFSETETRRSLIIPLLEKSFVAPIKDRKRDAYLFGENLGEFIKSSQGIKKSGQLITPPLATTPGNLKGGPQRNQQRYQRGMPTGRSNAPRPHQSYQQRRPQQHQRRPPPPPAARRNPPPPAQTQSGPSRPRNSTAH